MTLEAKNRVALTKKGVVIKIFDNSNNLVPFRGLAPDAGQARPGLENKFSTIKDTAKHFGVGQGF